MYDMKNRSKLKVIDANAAEGMKAFWAFDKAARAPGAIPVKYKELMALARAAGASDQEISEAVVVAAALRAGAAITHGTHAIKSQE